MSADRIRHIQETVARAQESKLQEERQRLAAIERAKQEKEAAQKARIEAIQAANEARLRATGVVELFEQLRDSGVVRWTNNPVYEEIVKSDWLGRRSKVQIKVRDYTPACLNFSPYHEAVRLIYDKQEVCVYRDAETCRQDYDSYGKFLVATILSDNRLKVNGEIVDNNLDDVVARAIMNPEFGRI